MYIEISISNQVLTLYKMKSIIKRYSVSTAKKGAGEIMNSECTPRGEHVIAEKIGEGAEEKSVFVGRGQTDEWYDLQLRKLQPNRDWILTRILWLKGIEDGKNKGSGLDSYERYIYIHGSPDDVEMGKPGSKGCVRMKNSDVIELFDLVEVGTRVTISEK